MYIRQNNNRVRCNSSSDDFKSVSRHIKKEVKQVVARGVALLHSSKVGKVQLLSSIPFQWSKMLSGFRVLLLIVVLIGIVLISGYTQLMFGKAEPDERIRVKSRIFLQEKNNKIENTNRTAEAGNQNMVVFNRVPKTGSEMFQSFGKYLASVHGYHAYIDPQVMKLFPSPIEQEEFSQNFQKLNDTGIYFRHMTYFEFDPRPIYVSIVRNPIDRMVSWFYYQRWKNRPDDENPQEICNKSATWKNFCKEMERLRSIQLEKDEKWYKMSFDQCVQDQLLPECIFNTGNGHLLQKVDDFRSQMMFFCGNSVECSLFNSVKLLNKAKKIVEEKYSVVGVLEDLDATFEALQYFLPKFFHNAKEIFNENLHNFTLTHTNKNPGKKAISNETRTILEAKFAVEIEFYEFCKQRLHSQINMGKSSSNFKWPDQLSRNEIVAEDDYVLL